MSRASAARVAAPPAAAVAVAVRPVRRPDATVVVPLPVRRPPPLPASAVAAPREDARAAELRRIIAALAPALGIDPAAIVVRADRDAAARTDARGALALATPDAILLHPDRVDPATAPGRHIVAHEIAHVAQRRLAGRPMPPAVAEWDAERIAGAFVAGLTPERPRARLAATAVAAFQAAEELAARRGELARIRALLHPVLWISDGDVAEILTLLVGLELASGLALIEALKADERRDLIDNINDSHFKPFRREVLLVYEATPAGELHSWFDERLLTGIGMLGLDPLETVAVQHVFDALAPAARDRLLASKVGGAVRAVAEKMQDTDVASRFATAYGESVDRAAKERTDLADRRGSAKARVGETGSELKQTIWRMRKELDRFFVGDANVIAALDAATPFAEDAAALQAIADGLVDVAEPPPDESDRYVESKNLLDTLLDEMPVEVLYDRGSPRLRTVVRLLGARPAWKNAAFVRKLGTGWFAGTDDAFLALNVVKALPERERIAFVAKSPVWAAVQKKLAPSQRGSTAVNLYDGGENQEDRNGLLAQLTEDRAWADPLRLSPLIGMAIAAGEYAWVFAESQRRIAAQPSLLDTETLLALVEKYRLYNPRPDAKGRDGKLGPRTEFDQEAYRPAAFGPKTGPTDSNTGLLHLIFGGIGKGLSALTSLKHPQPDTFALSGVNLADAQDILNSEFFGVTLKRHDDLGLSGRDAKRTGKGVNFLESLRWDLANREVTVSISELALSSMQLMVGARKIQASGGSLRGIEVMIRYAAKTPDQPVAIDLYIGEVRLDDVLLIGTGAMLGAVELGVDRLRLLLNTAGTDPAPTRPDDAMLPVGLGVVFDALGAMFGSASDRLLATAKLDLAGSRRPMSLDVSLDAFRVKGLSTSGGQHARSATVRDVAIRGGGDRRSYLDALTYSRQRLETRIAFAQRAQAAGKPGDHAKIIAQLEKQRDMAARELAAFAELDRLRAAKQRHAADPDNAPAPTAAQGERLAVLERQFGEPVGLVADIGSIAAEGIQGLPVSGFKAENLHGQGASLSALLSNGMFPQLLQGQPTLQPGARRDAGFALAIGSLETGAIHLAGGIPTPQAAADDVTKFLRGYRAGEPGAAERLQELRHRSDLAARYAALLTRGIPNLGVDARKELASVRGELEALGEKYAIDVKRVAAAGTVLEAREDGTLSAQFDSLVAEDVQDRGRGLSARRISATDLAVSPRVKDGLFGLSAWRQNLRSGTIGAGTFDIEGVRHARSGAEVERIAVTGAKVSADRDGPITVKASGVQLAMLSVETTRKLLLAELDLLARVPPTQNRTTDLARASAVTAALARLGEIESRAQVAATALDEARARNRPAAAKAAQRALDQARKDELAWQTELRVQGVDLQNLDIVALGLGDFLAADFDIEAALKRGITVMAGESGRLTSGGSVIGVAGPGMTAKAANFGAVSGTFTLHGDVIDVKGFRLETLGIDGLDYQGGGSRVWSRGLSQVTGITLDGRIGLRQVTEHDGTISRAPARFEIDAFGIDRVEATQLGFSSTSLGVSADLVSGAAEGIFVRHLVVDLAATDGGKTTIHGPAAVAGKQPLRPEFGVGALDHLRLNAVIGSSLTARGVLTGSDVKVTLLDAGERIHVGDLSVTEGQIGDPGKGGGKLTVMHLSGDILHRTFAGGDVFALRGIKLGSFVVDGGFAWKTDAAAVKIGAGATIADVTLAATIRRKKIGKDYVIEQIEVPELDVAKITAGQVDVTRGAVAADPANGVEASPEAHLSLEAATIDALHVEGFDLLKGLGTLQVGAQDINQLGFRIGKKGEAAFKQGGLSIKGTGLQGTLSGMPLTPGAGKLTIDLGRIETLSGSYEDNTTKIGKFGTKDVRGGVEIGADYVEVRDFNAGPITLGDVRYADDKGNTVTLGGATTGPMHLLSLRASFAKDAKGELALSSVVLKELLFEHIEASSLTYTGITTTMQDTTETVATQQIEAQTARIEPLHLVNLGLDLTNHVTSIEGGANRVSMAGFGVSLERRVGGKLKESTVFRSDITATRLAAKLRFGKVKRADGRDFTQSEGWFSLGSLGLSDPSVTVRDRIGESDASRLAIGAMTGTKGGIDVTGLKVTLAPNGTLLLDLDDIIANNLAIHQEKGKNRIDVALPFAQIKAIALGLKERDLKDGIDILAAQTGAITTRGLNIQIHRLREGTGPGPFPAAERFVVEPLGGANGKLIPTVTTQIFGVDVHARIAMIPVENGIIDWDKVDLLEENDEDEKQKAAERDKDQAARKAALRKQVAETTRSAYDPATGKLLISLRQVVEGFLNLGPTPNDPVSSLAKLENAGLERSEMQLGAGRIGTDTYSLRLEPGVTGSNLVQIVQSVIGRDLQLKATALHAGGFDFKVAQHAGDADASATQGKTGAIDFTKVGVRITGLANASAEFDITLSTESGTISGVSFGQVSLLKPAAMAAVPGPALKQPAP